MSLWEDYAGDYYPDDDDVACKYCGEVYVEWHNTGGRWVLFDLETGKPHVCNPPTPDDFEDIS